MIAIDSPSQAVNFSIRMNRQLKTDSELLYRSLGLSLSAAIQVFLKQSLISGGIPFQVRMPNYNAETLAAMRESEDTSSTRWKWCSTLCPRRATRHLRSLTGECAGRVARCLDIALQEGLQARPTTPLRHCRVEAHRPSFGPTPALAGAKQGSSPAQQLGGVPRVPHCLGLAFGVPSRRRPAGLVPCQDGNAQRLAVLGRRDEVEG